MKDEAKPSTLNHEPNKELQYRESLILQELLSDRASRKSVGGEGERNCRVQTRVTMPVSESARLSQIHRWE